MCRFAFSLKTATRLLRALVFKTGQLVNSERSELMSGPILGMFSLLSGVVFKTARLVNEKPSKNGALVNSERSELMSEVVSKTARLVNETAKSQERFGIDAVILLLPAACSRWGNARGARAATAETQRAHRQSGLLQRNS